MPKKTPKPAGPPPKEGDLKVWWIPQVPGKAFEVPVVTFREAALLIKTLANYDLFQYENRIKDYCNTGGLQVFDPAPEDEGGGWVDFHTLDGDDFNDLDEATVAALDAKLAKGEPVADFQETA